MTQIPQKNIHRLHRLAQIGKKRQLFSLPAMRTQKHKKRLTQRRKGRQKAQRAIRCFLVIITYPEALCL